MTPTERESLITGLLPVARRVAHYFARRYPCNVVDEDDLYTEAVLGVMRAVECYTGTGLPLERYASMRASFMVRNALAKFDPLGRGNHASWTKAERFICDFANEHDRFPSSMEVEAAVPGYQALLLREQARSQVSLDVPFTEGAVELPFKVAEAIMNHDDPATIFERETERDEFWSKVDASVSEEQATALHMIYRDQMQYNEVARETGALEDTVKSRVHRAIRKKLPKVLAA